MSFFTSSTELKEWKQILSLSVPLGTVGESIDLTCKPLLIKFLDTFFYIFNSRNNDRHNAPIISHD